MHAETIAKIKHDWKVELERTRRQERPAGFPALPEIPIGRYTREDFFQLEKTYLWPKSWLLAGHASEVPQPGDYKLWDAMELPIIILRDREGRVRAFFNVCQHRGGPLVTEPRGNRKSLSCIYHGWTYGLDGKLNFVTDEYDFAALDKNAKGLVELRCEMWGSLIFVNQDPGCVTLREHLGAIHEELADMRFDTLSMFAKLIYDIDCNWKCVQDAFEEGYHINILHKNTVAQFIDTDISTRRFYPNGHTHQIVQKRSGEDFEKAAFFDREQAAFDPAHEITRDSSRAYAFFPNLICPVAETQFPLMATWPRGVNACRVEVYYLATPGHGDPESEACKTVTQMFDVVTQEDLSILTRLQAGMRSGAIKGIPLSYAERNIYHHHETLDRMLGIERVPPDLAVKQILSAYIEP